MRSLLILLTLLCAFLPSRPASAETANAKTPEYHFYRAGEFYEHAEYKRAAAEYEQVLQLGMESGPLYFNTANAYFRAGDLGTALLNYERARRLIPRDEDLRANYSYALTTVRGEDTAGTRETTSALRLESITTDELSLTALGLLCAALLSFTLMLFVRVLRGQFRMLGASLLLLYVLSVGLIIQRERSYQNQALVTVPSATALFEPRADATEHFELMAGDLVKIEATRDDWSRVKRSDGRTGWIRNSAFGRI